MAFFYFYWLKGAKGGLKRREIRPCLFLLLLVKGRKRGAEKGQNPRPVFFYFYWLIDAERGRIRDVRKQSLGEDPKIKNRGRI